MHTGAILCGIAVGHIGTRGKWSTERESFKAGTTGVGVKFLGFYTAIAFVYGWVRLAANDGDSRLLGVLVFSAVWLFFTPRLPSRAHPLYSTAMAALTENRLLNPGKILWGRVCRELGP